MQNDSLNDLTNYDVKIRNIRFIGELAKFNIMQDGNPQQLLDTLKTCLDDFSGQNIEIVCNLIETCGRYLLNTMQQEYKDKLNQLLDLMWRLKEKDKISSRQLGNVE